MAPSYTPKLFVWQDSEYKPQWIIDLNVEAKTIKPMERNKSKSSWLWLGDSFLDTIPKAQVVKELIDQLEFVRIKNVCAAEDTIRRKGQSQQGRKYLQVICLLKHL